MSTPRASEDVKLISSLFSADEALIHLATAEMEDLFGPVEWKSPPLLFDRTTYYAREMGWPLHRRFLSFLHLIRPEAIVEIKLQTNALEKKYLDEGKRRINIDPGYITLERVILATGKNYIHRIYLSQGIYADLTLVFHKGSFRPLEWTYRDYADPGVVASFNEVRARYKCQIRGVDENTFKTQH